MSDDTRPGDAPGGDHEYTARPRMVQFLIAVLVFQGLSGLAGGFGLVLDPTGALIGLPAEWLSGSPFDDYTIPGLVLLTVLGVGPLAAAHGVWTRKSWSWAGSLLVASALFSWLGVEIAVIGYQAEPPLQLLYGIVALLILGATLLPGVRSHLSKDHA